MQSYSSAVDGKTFVRVGGGQSAQTLSRPSNSTLHSVRSDLGVSSATSSRRSNVTSSTASSSSHVTIASPGIRRADTTHDVRQPNASVTVKSVAPVKKMTSFIDTKTGHVTSSMISQERSNPGSVLTMTSSPTSMTSPSSLLTYGPESPSGDSIHNWMTSSSPRATSVLMTSTGRSMQVNSVTSEGTANTSTDSRIPASRNSSSIILSSIPGKLPAEMTSSGHVMTTTTTTVAQAEVHPQQQEARRSKGPLPDSMSVKQNDSAGLSTERTDESEIDFHSVGKESIDQEQVFSDVIIEGRDAVFEDSTEVALPVPDASVKTTSSALATSPSVALLSTPPSGISKVPDDSRPDVVRTDGGSDGGLDLDLDSETRQPSTFRFIGWNGNESTVGGTVDSQWHRVLVYKDTEIVLMLKASCSSEMVGCDQRLYDLMVDIAINCTERLKKRKDIAQTALQAEHLDTLPLTDSRSTKEHLEELSRELNETVSISDVAYRFQSKDGVFIGTFIDGNVALKRRNCTIGSSGVVVVLVKKNRFATVEAFADQLCRHIVSKRPMTLGRVSDEELRKRNLGSPEIGEGKASSRSGQLLMQKFLSDPSIIVAEAARRSFLLIQDFLLF